MTPAGQRVLFQVKAVTDLYANLPTFARQPITAPLFFETPKQSILTQKQTDMMNNEDICKARFELQLEAAENERRRQTMAEIEGEKHRNNLMQENDRHHEELRRINDEARVAAQDIKCRRMALNIEEAKLKDLANKTNTGNE